MEKTIAQANSVADFKKFGHKVIDMLAEQLQCAQSDDDFQTLNWASPQEQLAFWQKDFNAAGGGDPEQLFSDMIARSVQLHSPRYLAHQVPPTWPIASLTAALMAFLNNGMAVYEMGMAGNAMERIIIEYLTEGFGLGKNAAGFITSGGSLGNLTALLAARASHIEKKTGAAHDLAVMVSAEAHYSIERACAIMGIPAENVIKVPVNEAFHMDMDALEPCYGEAERSGKKVFCIVGCCGSTATGSYDDLEAIGDFAKRHNIWFHADGAHGAAIVFSPTYRHLMKGIEKVDSLILDFHKMLAIPSLSTAIIFRTRRQSLLAFHQKAVYLWPDQEHDEWYNSGKQTYECTKPMSIIHIYTLLKVYGEKLLHEHIDKLFDLTQTFAAMIAAREDFELLNQPQSNIICFRYKNDELPDDELNQHILDTLTKEGRFYIAGITLHEQFYLRMTFMNPVTQVRHLQETIDAIVCAGEMVYAG